MLRRGWQESPRPEQPAQPSKGHEPELNTLVQSAAEKRRNPGEQENWKPENPNDPRPGRLVDWSRDSVATEELDGQESRDGSDRADERDKIGRVGLGSPVAQDVDDQDEAIRAADR